MWNFSPENFIEQLYKALLGRPADRYGHENWTQIIVDGKDPTIAVTGLMDSDEYRALRGIVAGNAVFISTPVRIDRPGYDFSISVHPRNDVYVSNKIKDEKAWKPFMTNIIERILPTRRDFYDIGAHIGWFSVVAGKMLVGRGTVHTFEPARDNVAVLAQNITQNALTNVRVTPCALGSSVHVDRVYFSGTNKGDHRVYASGETRSTSPVGIMTLDDYFDHASTSPILIKIDTQGSERDVVAGMARVLAERHRDVVLILKFRPAGLRRNGDSALQLVDVLRKARFECVKLEEQDDRLSAIGWDDVALYAADEAVIASDQFIDLVLYRKGSPAFETIEELVERSTDATDGRSSSKEISHAEACGEGDIDRSFSKCRQLFATDRFDVVVYDRHGNQCTIEYPPYRLAESHFVIGLHKAGSVLLNELVEAICAEIGKCTVPISSFLFSSGMKQKDMSDSEFVKLDQPGYIYNGFRTSPDRMPSYRQAKKLLLVRDPRDVAVSYYFSTLYSHPLPGDGPLKGDFEAKRRKLSKQNINEIILSGGMDKIFDIQNYFSSRKYNLERLTIFRYEDVIYRKMRWLSQILEWLEAELDSNTKAAIVKRFDVFPASENPGAHVRQVAPGNYKSHLSKDAIVYIEKLCWSFFDAFGYDRDRRGCSVEGISATD